MLGKQLQTAAAGSAAAGGPLGVEDVFSTYLYDGTYVSGLTPSQSIDNGIDLAGKGGMVWTKARNATTWNTITHLPTYNLSTNDTQALGGPNDYIESFDSSGFTVGANTITNKSGDNYASWTFRKAPGFFDVVTYTGNSVNGRTINHNLGSVPGCIIVKTTTLSGGGAENWYVWHRSISSNDINTSNNLLRLNLTNDIFTGTKYLANPTSTTFQVGNAAGTNASGEGYVAYLFAHDEAIFGENEDQSIIKCGSYTGTTTDQSINVGWEPQWVLIKNATWSTDWHMFDNMRGFGVRDTGDSAGLRANLNYAEQPLNRIHLNSTGFEFQNEQAYSVNQSGQTYIYIAIRRGPTKTPTDATEVFQTLAYSGSGGVVTRSTNILVDALFTQRTTGGAVYALDRLRKGTNYLSVSGTSNEGLQTDAITEMGNDYLNMGAGPVVNSGSSDYCLSMFRRAPGFFDVVAYTGTGSARTINHNLGVAPELMFFRLRSASKEWVVYSSALGASTGLSLTYADAQNSNYGVWNSTAPTATVFSIGSQSEVNSLGNTYISYHFATLDGVSKVGSYTGTAATLNVDCGFTTGARFVLIKRTDTTITGQTYDTNWYVWNTVRGITAGNDPFMLLNTSGSENTSTDFIDPYASGFTVTSSAPAALNASGGTYIFLAVA